LSLIVAFVLQLPPMFLFLFIPYTFLLPFSHIIPFVLQLPPMFSFLPPPAPSSLHPPILPPLLLISLQRPAPDKRVQGLGGSQDVLCAWQVSLEALQKRHAQGWLREMEPQLDRVIQRIREAKRTKQVGTRWRLFQATFYPGLELQLMDCRNP
jgi:hypothetical protein